MSRIIDVSMEISPDMVTWPGARPVRYVKICSMDDGAIANSTNVDMGMHTGTHVDAPLHFVADGKSTATIGLEHYMGKAKVFDIDADRHVTSEHLKPFDIRQGDTVMLNIRKNNEYLLDDRFHEDFIALDPDGAEYLIGKRIKAVGINYYSIEAFDYLPGAPVHTNLLGSGIVIYEGLKLGGVAQGEYSYFCLPLKFKNGNGSPVRAVLIEE